MWWKILLGETGESERDWSLAADAAAAASTKKEGGDASEKTELCTS